MAMCAEKQVQTNTLIVGIGVSGVSCARYLHRHGQPFRLVDSRKVPPSLPAVQREFSGYDILTGGFDEDLLQQTDRILLSPGVPVADPFIQKALGLGIEVIGDIELFARNVNAPVIAITGSNGKSTVTTLVGEMMRAAGLRVAVGGNLGTAALDLLQTPAPDAYVLELSSFQLETTASLHPLASTVLNVSDDHMDRYNSLNEYAAAKAAIFQRARHSIVNRDDAIVDAMQAAGNRLTFTAGIPREGEFGLLAAESKVWLAHGKQKLLATDELKLVGTHNAMNALAALALVHAFGVDLHKTLPALRTFAGLPHRCQWVAEHNGVHWINDSKATNVGAAQAAIGSMPGSLVLIAGGDGKGADFTALRDTVANKVHTTILLGKDAQALEDALRDITHCQRVKDIKAAVEFAAAAARPGDTVLLAPACSSLDMFANYMERGDVFCRCVHEVLGI